MQDYRLSLLPITLTYRNLKQVEIMGSLTTKHDNGGTIGAVSSTAKKYIHSATSAATRQAYQSDARVFSEWCNERGVTALPATGATVADFIASQAESGLKVSTIVRRCAAIRALHEAAGKPTPTDEKVVRSTLRGIKREHGVAPTRKKALTVDMLYKVLARVDESTLQGKRDKAILLLGFSGAFRRSELAALEVSDLAFKEQGIEVFLKRSKTDQFAEGETVAIVSKRMDIAGALQDYMQEGGITSGALFRPISKSGNLRPQAITGKSIAEVVKRYASLAGFAPDDFAGHSLRSGFVTTALEHGASMFRVMDVTRHKSVQTLKGYARQADKFRDHAGSSFL